MSAEFKPITEWITSTPCPECGSPVKCLLGTRLICTNQKCPFEMGSCSGIWVDATEYNRNRMKEISK